jgi:hypothetical protein
MTCSLSVHINAGYVAINRFEDFGVRASEDRFDLILKICLALNQVSDRAFTHRFKPFAVIGCGYGIR